MAGAFNFWHTPLNVHFNNVDVMGHFTLRNFYCLSLPQAVSPPLSPSFICIVLLLLLQFVALSVGLSTVFRCFCLKRLTWLCLIVFFFPESCSTVKCAMMILFNLPVPNASPYQAPSRIITQLCSLLFTYSKSCKYFSFTFQCKLLAGDFSN